MQVETITVVKIKGIKVNGPTEVLRKCDKFIIVNWEGHATKIVNASMVLNGEMDLSWYEPCDKGGLSLFGVDKKGDVICGMALYLDRLNERCFEVVYRDKANPWG